MSRIKSLIKNTLIITIGRISTQFITFLLLPLYTALLSTEEYGIVDLIFTLAQLLIPLVTLMIDQSVFRYLLSCETYIQKKNIISNAFFLLLGFNLIFLILCIFVMPFISMSYKLWITLIVIIISFSNFFLQIARGLKCTIDYTFSSFICSLVIIVFNILCILLMKIGAIGMLLAIVVGNFVCCLYLFFKLCIFKYITIKNIKKKIIIDELRYSIPLVPNQLSLWVMNSSDRLIVSYVLGTATNGILAVSHKFSAIFMTFFNIFQLAWHEIGAVHYFDKDRDIFFNEIIEKIITFFATLCMCIIIILPLVFDLLINSSYSLAYNNIPIYLMASLLNVVVGLLGVVYIAIKKTFEIAKTTILAAMINILFNIILIKYIGLYAASISTFIGYLIAMIYRIIDTQKYLNIKYNYIHYMKITIGITLSCFIYYLNNKLISLITLPIFLGITLWVNKETIILIKNLIKKKKENHK